MSVRQGVLLVGGGGFLGSALAKALAAGGHKVHVLCRHLDPGHRDGIRFHRGSQDDPNIVLPLVDICDTVIHLASTTTPGSSARRPVVDTEENLLPAARLVESMTRRPPRRLIFVSSGGSVYGNPKRIPIDESAATQPLSYHAAGKLALESLFAAFAHANGVSLAILRPSNLYGPGQSLRLGFGLIRTLMEKAAHGEPVEVWGDGSAQRDYLYIDDAVAALLSVLGSPEAAGAFNVGSGTGTSIVEMIKLVERVSGRRLQVIRRPARNTDVQAIILDIGRLARVTGWSPKMPLEQGLRTTWTWVRDGLR